MPKQVTRKVGEIHEVKTVKTFGDKVVEFLEGVLGFAFMVGVIIVIVRAFF